MVLMSAVLYFSLTGVLCYTFLYRKTYPGFGSLALGQLAWSIGVFFIFFRILGRDASLVVGNGLLFAHGVLWYRGIALYGGIERIARRNLSNILLAVACECLILYYVYADFDTCRRVVVVSVFCLVVYCRIALEPYWVRRWRTYSMQPVFSGILTIVAVAYAVRTGIALQAADCAVGGGDPVTKLLLLASMLLLSFLTFCLLSMTSGRVESELREARDALCKQAQTDFLTGLPNRRHFLQQASRLLEAFMKRGEVVSLLMLDLDHFKNINDTYGHQTGDVVLRAVGRCLAGILRDVDRIGRLGGEEFGVLLPGLGAQEAAAVAQHLREAVADLRPGGHAVTASLGVASGAMPLNALLAQADVCLYAAKRAGRNRVVVRDCHKTACPEETV